MSYLESLRVFTRVVELGSITSGGRDLRLTPAVASKRVKDLEARMGVRLLNRTTRTLTPTEAGKVLYEHAIKVVAALEEAEAAVAGISGAPRGTIRVLAPLGLGRRIVAPLVPEFADAYPDVSVRLRLSDRKVDMLEDGIDVAFHLGALKDSTLKLRNILQCERVLCAAPDYLSARGTPETPEDLIDQNHNCLLLRFPRSPEYFWTLTTPDGLQNVSVRGRYDADDGDVLTDWALAGRGIANKPLFDVADHLASGALVEVLPDNRPVAATLGCLYPHRRFQDPKVRLFIDFVADRCRSRLKNLLNVL